ncbi:MAG: hypothetical protein HY323_10810 [Betaproteobacteria bacterium]|nr:hypothetical protein [Betaproteobacteria bacterium]
MPEWRQDLERNLWEDTYMASTATARLLEAEHQETKAILTELGLAR